MTSVFCQKVTFPIDDKTGQITYSEVVPIEGKSKEDLNISAKKWFVNTFKSAQEVIQLEDRDQGVIVGKGNLGVTLSMLSSQNVGYVRFTVKIEVKEGRYRYSFTDFWHEVGSSTAVSPGDLRASKPGGGLLSMGMKNWNGIKEQTDQNVKAMIASLAKDMQAKSDVDDW